CNDVRYVGTSKKTRKSVTLIGTTVHSTGADGVTPTQFQGYSFKNGSTEYFVSLHGYLEVKKGKKILVYETGKWDWEKKGKQSRTIRLQARPGLRARLRSSTIAPACLSRPVR